MPTMVCTSNARFICAAGELREGHGRCHQRRQRDHPHSGLGDAHADPLAGRRDPCVRGKQGGCGQRPGNLPWLGQRRRRTPDLRDATPGLHVGVSGQHLPRRGRHLFRMQCSLQTPRDENLPVTSSKPFSWRRCSMCTTPCWPLLGETPSE
jgi:hypothetical protein